MMMKNTNTYPPATEIFPLLIESLTEGKAAVETIPLSNLTLFQVTFADKRYVGKIIGRNGSLVSALRQVLITFSGSDDHSYRIEVL